MLRVKSLYTEYASEHGTVVKAAQDVSFEVPEGKLFTLLGPSGCGKTTTLRSIAGLERPVAGEIEVGGKVVYSSGRGVFIAPNRRNFGMVFQSYAIWPHMSVFENIAFPLRYKRPKPSSAEIRERVMRALALVRLDGLQDRPAPYLSGGQQQRLAVARALVAEPRVLLLDEPLSNLDAKLRDEMRLELREVVARLKVTTLFVTHEQIEALTMSDTIAVMRDGVIVQQGAPADIYAKPSQPFVADFIGRTNMIAGRVVALDGSNGARQASVETPFGTLQCRAQDGIASGDTVAVAVRPENVAVADGGQGGQNTVAGTIETTVFLGNMLDCIVAVGGERLHIQLHPSAAPARGAHVNLRLPAEHCLAMRR